MALFEWIDRHRVIAISAGNAAVLITAITVAALRSDAGIAAGPGCRDRIDARWRRHRRPRRGPSLARGSRGAPGAAASPGGSSPRHRG
jgi:hypothetical protein